ncbi:5-formyltetrahydrofolate cyclo-ligase [Tremella mesenterica]|uniref:5-formyltetrahydrofolate cyclo-ligase n=1 Tax=Tremella mesenterica TaxID=5217 RepID=A0A4V1M3X4_TREME|nr:5-formyltetrahydrofolate cyclo-ligase [Tremella mesenterica]
MSAFALKSGLRKSMLRTLRSMSDVRVEEQSQTVFRILSQQPFYRDAKTVGCYLSMAHAELRTPLIVDDLLSHGQSLFVPYLPPTPADPIDQSTFHAPSASVENTIDAADMHFLRLYSKEDQAACPLDKWGILDPGVHRGDDPSQPRRQDALNLDAPDLDVILLPGVAFDHSCNRLGRGKGYYDRYIRRYTNTRPSPLLVGLALTPQILPPGEEVPVTETDASLDCVVSPSGLTWRKGAERHVPRSLSGICKGAIMIDGPTSVDQIHGLFSELFYYPGHTFSPLPHFDISQQPQSPSRIVFYALRPTPSSLRLAIAFIQDQSPHVQRLRRHLYPGAVIRLPSTDFRSESICPALMNEPIFQLDSQRPGMEIIRLFPHKDGGTEWSLCLSDSPHHTKQGLSPLSRPMEEVGLFRSVVEARLKRMDEEEDEKQQDEDS